MGSSPPSAFPWVSSPLDEYMASLMVMEAEVDENVLRVEAFLAVGEQVDPFRVRPPSAPLPPSSWAANAWNSARAFLFSARRLEAGPLLRPLKPGQLTPFCSNVGYLQICYPNFPNFNAFD
jgi:hypothetical protein